MGTRPGANIKIQDSKLDCLLLSDEVTPEQRDAFLEFMDAIGANDAFLYSNNERKLLSERYGLGEDAFFRLPDGRSALLFPHRPSLALCDLATTCRQHGYEVHIIDNVIRLMSRRMEFMRLVRARSPRLIGLSTTFLMTVDVVTRAIEVVRRIAPESKLVLGGPSIRAFQNLHGLADFCVFGAGELPIVQILEVLDGNRSPESISNSCYLTEHGTVAYSQGGAQAALVGQAGSAFKVNAGIPAPIPDWSIYSRSRDCVYGIELSRGCNYNCYYCDYDRGKEIRRLDDIRTELLRNAELGISKYRIVDSNFTDGPPRYSRWPYDVCQMIIDMDLGIQWSCYARVDDLDDELCSLLRRAGCFAVFLGIESGHDSVLKLMRKGHNVADAYEGIAVAMRNGVYAHANFICGYPGETAETFDSTLEFIEKARPSSAAIGKFFAHPMSPVFGRHMQEFALEGAEGEWAHATMTSDQAGELVFYGTKRIAAAGINPGTEYEFGRFMSLGLSHEEVVELMDVYRRTTAPKSVEDAAAANEVLREYLMNRVPRAVADDYRMMRAAPTA